MLPLFSYVDKKGVYVICESPIMGSVTWRLTRYILLKRWGTWESSGVIRAEICALRSSFFRHESVWYGRDDLNQPCQAVHLLPHCLSTWMLELHEEKVVRGSATISFVMAFPLHYGCKNFGLRIFKTDCHQSHVVTDFEQKKCGIPDCFAILNPGHKNVERCKSRKQLEQLPFCL